jgi:hypothetical protein
MRALAGAQARLTSARGRPAHPRLPPPPRPCAARGMARAAPPAPPPPAPVVSDLAPMLRKVAELNNGAGALGSLVPLVVDGAVLGRMRPE